MEISREEKIHLLASRTPNSFAVMQRLVMALAAVHKSYGKKTLFGRSPTVKAYAKLDSVMSEQIIALRIDGLIEHGSSDEKIHLVLAEYINLFADAFPSWPDAYSVAAHLLLEDLPAGIEYISRRR